MRRTAPSPWRSTPCLDAQLLKRRDVDAAKRESLAPRDITHLDNLSGKHMVLIGLNHRQEIARRAKAFDMTVTGISHHRCHRACRPHPPARRIARRHGGGHRGGRRHLQRGDEKIQPRGDRRDEAQGLSSTSRAGDDRRPALIGALRAGRSPARACGATTAPPAGIRSGRWTVLISPHMCAGGQGDTHAGSSRSSPTICAAGWTAPLTNRGGEDGLGPERILAVADESAARGPKGMLVTSQK